MMAPVKVARSTITSGLYWRCAQVIASARTRRPSASVLITSMVWPDREVTTSPGRWALPSGMFSNDDGLAAKLEAAGKASGDRLWRMPMNDDYNKIMDSQIADMKNSASREGGSITAACFLQRFVEEGVKWAHLDIAGMAWSDKASHLYDKGATGYGVALLDRYLADNHEG